MGSKRTLRALAAVGTLAVGFALTISLSTAPAAATEDPNVGTIDTSITSVVTEEQQALAKTKGDEVCTPNKCKRINWCVPPGHKPPVGIAADAPLVLLSNEKDETPSCIKKPKVDYKCCVADEHGTASVHVIVTNNHKYKMLTKVGIDDGEPIVRWVEGNGKETFVFKNVPNGPHKIHASVWVGDHTWCHFAEKPVKVKCASPSPSISPSPSVTPSPSVSQTEQPPPGGELPQTGDKVLPIVGMGGAAALAGVGLLFLARRRRAEVDPEIG